MIRADEVEKIIDEQENIKLNYKKRILNSIVEKVEIDMLNELKKNKPNNNYVFEVILTGFWLCGEDYAEVAITRNKNELNHGVKLVEEKLKSCGWKNIQIKVCNPWWPLNPKFKVSIER